MPFFPDCESALAHFNSGPASAPGYVFIDISLPRVTGDQCLQQLQKIKEFDNPCIIIYSSSIPNEWKKELEQIGVNKFLQKTDSIPALVDEIQHLIQA